MNRIAEEVERDPLYPTIIAAQRPDPEPTGADAIAFATRDIGRDARPQGHRGLDGVGRDRACASRASGRACRSWR